MGYEGRDRERWVAEDPAQKRADRDDFARDRARVVHSSSLRRLAAKTQVLAPGHDDFVRNRLTHSLEVAQIGREFGAALGCNADVVDTACLAHDLGHPPFGHNGETVLDEIASGIGGFEGNAQTLRLLTRLEAKRAHADGTSAGLNLTRASLDATTKYPWARGDGPYETHKFGVYPSDLPVFEWIREGAQPQRRCLEAEVMDWSDDVAYSVHDVEDAIASGWIDPRLLHSRDMADVIDVAGRTYAPDLGADALGAALERILASGAVPTAYDGSRGDLARLKDMTSRLIGHFVLVVEQATRERHGPGEPVPLRGRPRGPRRHARRVLRAQGHRQPLRHDHRRAPRDHVGSARRRACRRRGVCRRARGAPRRGLPPRPRGRCRRRGTAARRRRPGGLPDRRPGARAPQPVVPVTGTSRPST